MVTAFVSRVKQVLCLNAQTNEGFFVLQSYHSGLFGSLCFALLYQIVGENEQFQDQIKKT